MNPDFVSVFVPMYLRTMRLSRLSDTLDAQTLLEQQTKT